ncbi:hypothetical protein Nepgr_011984 [Nepenthes gracilis]|uniref:Uncharacterized protein n=1 Tax=Nepenthes gracilis TaxID=150966 RepID=A0AAD3SF77_NEPGR|nr:hypothetical protein Nepgr_011984 [Nepenthes gracilis]
MALCRELQPNSMDELQPPTVTPSTGLAAAGGGSRGLLLWFKRVIKTQNKKVLMLMDLLCKEDNGHIQMVLCNGRTVYLLGYVGNILPQRSLRRQCIRRWLDRPATELHV